MFRIDFLSVTFDCSVQCPRVGLKRSISTTHQPGVYMPLRALFLV